MSNPYGNDEAAPPTTPRQVNLDDELKPAPGRASATRLAFFAGLVLFPVVPFLLLSVAFFSGDGGFESGVFSVALVVIAIVSGLVGLLMLGIAGFLLLVYRGEDRAEAEVFGSAMPNPDRSRGDAGRIARLDLRYGWGPALVFLLGFALAQTLRAQLVPEDPDFIITMLEIVGGILNVLALLLFLFFWTAGYLRLNRAGVRIEHAFYAWPLVGLGVFFLPVFLL